MRFLLLCTLVAAALPMTPLRAQSDWLPIPVEEPRRVDRRPYAGEWHFGFDAGFANFIPTQFNERGTRLQVFAERQLHPWVAVQASGDCSRGSRPIIPGNPQEFVSLCGGVLSAVVPIPLHPRVWPYLRAGYGFALWDDFSAEGFVDIDEIEPNAVLGVGLRSYFNNKQTIGMRIDAQRQQTRLYGDPVTHWSFGLGLSLRMLPR